MPLQITVSDYCRGCRQHRQTLIVQSREGGLVTRDCLTSGTSNSVRMTHLPNLYCGRCSSEIGPSKNSSGNYAYACRCCRTSVELAQLVPFWDEEFDYSGFGIETDDEVAFG